MGKVLGMLEGEEHYTLTIQIPVVMNVESLGASPGDVEICLNAELEKLFANHPPFDVQMLTHGLGRVLKTAMRGAIGIAQRAKHGREVNVMHSDDGRIRGESPVWLDETTKLDKQISMYWTEGLTAEIE